MMATTTTKREQLYEQIRKHGEDLLRIFPQATEQDPVKLCKKLRRMETEGERQAVAYCNGDHDMERHETLTDQLLARVNKLLGNTREYQPKTGAKCGCKQGLVRDNCPTCEGTGQVVDFRAIRTAPPTVPVFINSDPRGHALKIRDEWVRDAQVLCRDGRTVYVGTKLEEWIHRHHSYSVVHALKHEGFTIKSVSIHRDWGGYGIIAPDLTENS